ncbi:telomere-capping, CST complex subunit-domain-containing protein [Endogone sp. FLAS-F59071]|nr:telomere-capping, CST complex subunit-domain-containing protein [Endogone sp. FLAS-F59071]|eukprot:RUS22041.1 telomere-capping, CST complex subunit-domain-containing protein [Endogone sp. FLAS-F59071]
MATKIIPHGVVYFLSEITADSQHMIGRSVRVNGTLLEYDAHANRAVIEHEGARLLVDTSLLGVFPHRERSLFQWIGEISVSDEHTAAAPLILRARVVRNIDGLDLRLYEQAVRLRRRFERSSRRQSDQSGTGIAGSV